MQHDAAREERILSLQHSVHVIALAVARTLPRTVRLEDLESAGWLGAIDAVDRWDPRTAELMTFAKWRIRGAIIDSLRLIDPLSRYARAKHKLAEKEAREKDEPLPHSPVRLISIEEIDPAQRWMTAGEEPARRQTEARMTLASIMARSQPLTTNESIVIMRHEGHDEKLKAIGMDLGVKESRASQIRAKGLRKLRKAA